VQRGAEVRWVDTGVRGWEDLLAALETPVDVLVHFPPAARLVDRSGTPALERIFAALDALKPVEIAMARRGRGRVIRLLSRASEWPMETANPATLGNRLVAGITVGAAQGAARFGVTFNDISLGLIEGLGRADAELKSEADELLRHTPMRRAGTLQEVAAAVAFLASPRAGFITGITLPVCGGLGLGLYPEQFETPTR
jgi:NAD(P)-dependent dehydrogenase (short-subunit alcohol dehydrogenase family)